MKKAQDSLTYTYYHYNSVTNQQEPIVIHAGEDGVTEEHIIMLQDMDHREELDTRYYHENLDPQFEEFKVKVDNKAAIKLPLRDGDVEREDEAYANSYFINANSKTQPQIVDKMVRPILDCDEVYSGCYARVSLSFYAFNSNGNRGIACGLGNIQKVRDGEPLGGRSTASDDFSAFSDDDDDEDFLS